MDYVTDQLQHWHEAYLGALKHAGKCHNTATYGYLYNFLRLVCLTDGFVSEYGPVASGLDMLRLLRRSG